MIALLGAKTATSSTACPKCGSSRIRRSARREWERKLEPLVVLKAYRCESCQKRFTRRS